MPAPPATPAAPGAAAPAAVTARADLTRYLNAYWLRPENAFWMTLRSRALAAAGVAHPAIDVSCGDGVFTFLHLGGDFDGDFDVFRAVGQLDRVHAAHADMFDTAAAEYVPRIVRPAEATWAYGLDLKPNLLAKAGRLGLYDRLIRHDNNQPLPLADGAVAGVYCNSAYWVGAIDPFLRELGRITRPVGRIVLHVKLAAMAEYSLEPFRRQLGDRFLEIIGRGRLACWPTVASRREWERRFVSAGLEIVAATPFVTRTHAHLWDVGLRPLAPLLVRMANGLTPATRAAVKRDWIALFEQLLEPLCRPDLELLAGQAEPAEVQYVLKPRAHG